MDHHVKSPNLPSTINHYTTRLRAGGSTLTGADLTVKIDGKTGGIASLRSRRLGAQLVDQKAATAINDYFYLLGNDLKNLQRNGPVKISVKESGPLVASLLIESDAPGCNQLTREVRLVAGPVDVPAWGVVTLRAELRE